MTNSKRSFQMAIFGGLSVLFLLLASVATAQLRHSEDAMRGKQLYYLHGCYGCHGFNGETGARRLVGTGSPIIEKPEIFIAFLRARADAAPMLPSEKMPSFSKAALSDADAQDIFAYVHGFVLNAPDPSGIPAFQSIIDSARADYKPTQ